MKLIRFLWVGLFLQCGIVLSNPFESGEWDPYRLKNHAHVLSFSTDRLMLRPVTSENFQHLFEEGKKLFSQDQVLAYWGGSRTDTEENTTKWEVFLKRCLHRQEAGLLSWKAVYLKETKTFLGFVGGNRYVDARDTHTSYDGAIEIAYAFDPGSWGKGYATEALRGFLSFDVNRLENYSYVFATVHPENTPSIKVLKEKAGLHAWALDQDIPDFLKRENRQFYKIDKDELLSKKLPRVKAVSFRV